MKDSLGEIAKAVTTFVSLIVMALVARGFVPESEAGAVIEAIVTLIVVLIGTYATWRIPNKPKEPQ